MRVCLELKADEYNPVNHPETHYDIKRVIYSADSVILYQYEGKPSTIKISNIISMVVE